ncbi:MAG TPA: GGDEF domain-containing protein, partial [Steroidobacteraceae bacterium]|nr:GGDEF domain-containing protein [Steroidobacteraceae bacterium]
RRSDTAVRYGGEEFVVVLPETPQSEAKAAAERIRAEISRAPRSSQRLTVTVSIGVATDPTEDILVRADRAMYGAKRAGKNRVALWSEACSVGITLAPSESDPPDIEPDAARLR